MLETPRKFEADFRDQPSIAENIGQVLRRGIVRIEDAAFYGAVLAVTGVVGVLEEIQDWKDNRVNRVNTDV